jgi:O-methyltransferase
MAAEPLLPLNDMPDNKTFSQWLTTSPVLSLPRRVTWRAIVWLLAQRGMVAVPAAENSYRSEDYALIRRIASETDMLLLRDEAYQLLSCTRATQKVEGAMAEIGVYRGGSARLMCEGRGNRALYLFDTFEGLPTTHDLDNCFGAGQYAASIDDVRKYLASFENVHIYKGLFPATSTPISHNRFSFVHLDVDLYETTRDCLDFFYPLLNPGGMFLIHDFLWAEGVRKAVQEFFVTRPEPILELAGTYCAITKL